MPRVKKVAHKVNKTDDEGRPVDVYFTGNPRIQCPACLSTKVRPDLNRGIGFLPAGDRISDENMGMITWRKCDDCGGHWVVAGF
jgi:hypothetical protein